MSDRIGRSADFDAGEAGAPGPGDGVAFVTGIGLVALDSGPASRRLEEILALMGAEVPFEAGCVCVGRPAPQVVAQRGYSEAVLDHLVSPGFHRDWQRVGIRTGGTRLATARAATPPPLAVEEHLAGYADGVSVPLVSSQGNLTGAIHLSFGRTPADLDERIALVARAAPLVERVVRPLSERPRASGLTRREREVLGLVAEGRSNSEVAESLGIASRTVASHLEHILVKLGASNRTEAVVWAMRQGLLDA